MLDAAARHSATFDEVVYPTAGYGYLTTGDYRMNPEHPPLLKLWMALPWLGSGISAPDTPGWEERDQWTHGRAMLYRGPVAAETLLFRARVMIALLSVALAAAVAWTAWRIAGGPAAVAATLLWALDPLAIAHAGLSTTDLGAAALYFGACMAFPGALRQGGAGRLVAAGLLLGLALSAKFSTLPLLGVLGVLALALPALARGEGGGEGPSSAPTLPRSVGRAAIVAAVGLMVLIASYGPAGPGNYLIGLNVLRAHGVVGHPAYAFGQYGSGGWWWFFPAAWAVKTPLPLLAATLAGSVALVVGFRRRPLPTATLLLPPALVVTPSLFSGLNLGVRHLLPVTPFLAVAGGIALGALWRKGRAGAAIVLVAVAWLAFGTLRSHPHELAYSNEAAGGTEATWKLLADSNIDWGQDLPELARLVGAQPLRRLYLAYFGTADPATHGLVYHWLPSAGMAEPRRDDGDDPAGREWIAISTTTLLGVYEIPLYGRDLYAWLREREPDALAGGSIALFDITGDAASHARLGRAALEAQRPWAAEAPLRRALQLDPGLSSAGLDLFVLLAARGDRQGLDALCAGAGPGPLRDRCGELPGLETPNPATGEAQRGQSM